LNGPEKDGKDGTRSQSRLINEEESKSEEKIAQSESEEKIEQIKKIEENPLRIKIISMVIKKDDSDRFKIKNFSNHRFL
jgi:hypothetical protein